MELAQQDIFGGGTVDYDLETQFLKAKIRKEKALARSYELKNAEASGQLVQIEQAIRIVEAALASVKKALNELPRKLAPQMVTFTEMGNVEIFCATRLTRSLRH